MWIQLMAILIDEQFALDDNDNHGQVISICNEINLHHVKIPLVSPLMFNWIKVNSVGYVLMW